LEINDKKSNILLFDFSQEARRALTTATDEIWTEQSDPIHSEEVETNLINGDISPNIVPALNDSDAASESEDGIR